MGYIDDRFLCRNPFPSVIHDAVQFLVNRGNHAMNCGDALRRAFVGFVALIFLGAPAAMLAQTDEIQVYDAEIEPLGVFNVMNHMNFTPNGRKIPAYTGAIIANHSFQSTLEWAYGVKPWMEQGLYLPVSSLHSENHGATFNGFKIRELFVKPNAHEDKVFYGINFEFSVNAHYWEQRRISSEVRPIIELHLHPIDLIYNPIVDTNYTGGLGNLQYNPAGRIAYNLNDNWAIAAEEYDGFGPLNGFLPLHQQFHEVWATMDHETKLVNIEAGAGYGLTAGSDKWTLKLMLSRDINKKPWRP